MDGVHLSQAQMHRSIVERIDEGIQILNEQDIWMAGEYILLDWTTVNERSNGQGRDLRRLDRGELVNIIHIKLVRNRVRGKLMIQTPVVTGLENHHTDRLAENNMLRTDPKEKHHEEKLPEEKQGTITEGAWMTLAISDGSKVWVRRVDGKPLPRFTEPFQSATGSPDDIDSETDVTDDVMSMTTTDDVMSMAITASTLEKPRTTYVVLC